MVEYTIKLLGPDSGKRRAITRRVVRNKRLCPAGYLWAFSLLTASPAARANYDRRRERGYSHAAAGRHLANRYFGILYHCLQTRQLYDEATLSRQSWSAQQLDN